MENLGKNRIIKEIQEILCNIGDFDINDLYCGEKPPRIHKEGKQYLTAETYTFDYVTIYEYINECPVDEYNVDYEMLTLNELKDVLRICNIWKDQCSVTLKVEDLI